MFEQLDFIYLPSRDVASEMAYYTERLGGELVFAIERFGTRVAMIRPHPQPPALLLAQHLEGDQPVLVFRVDDLEEAVAELQRREVGIKQRFEIPHGPGVELTVPGPQRLALYELARPERVASIVGRRDF